MTILNPSPTLISQSELGRRLNIPAPRLAKAIREGKIVPTEKVCGRMNLFESGRIEEIARLLTPNTIIA